MIWVILGFVVGFLFGPIYLRRSMIDKHNWKITWTFSVISGIIVALFELSVVKFH